MRVLGLICALAAALGGADVPPSASGQPVAKVSFQFERPGLQVPRYTVTLLNSGEMVYQGEEVTPTPRNAASETPAEVPPGRPFNTVARLSPATTKKIFSTAKSLKNFNVDCGSHLKNLADTGKKTLSFTGPEGRGECTYNFSDNKSVAQLTDTFLAVVETMDEGRQLDHLHRYDRLGLDAAITTLAEQVTAGRALGLETIAGTLRSIAADTNLIQRVRVRASQLLSLVPADSQQ